MPRDSKGGFHLNSQRAMAADKMAGGGKPMAAPKMGGAAVAEKPMGEDTGESVGHITIHKHADGGYRTETHDGQTEQHPHLGHALMHAAAHHEPDAKHMHVQHDGMSGEMTSHHVGEDGGVQGPHQHPDAEAAGEHMKQFMAEEGREGGGDWGKHEGGGMEGMAGI